jgi:hypothetical protein
VLSDVAAPVAEAFAGDANATYEVALEDLPILHPMDGHSQATLDINDKCNLFCPTCFRGTGGQKNSSSVMPLDKFDGVIRKVSAEGYRNITLVNWTEPFLCKTIDQYIGLVKQYGLNCWLSSNLSLPPQQYADVMLRALAAGLDILFVSVSGFTQETYRINHVGGRLDWVKENLAMLSRARRERKFATSVWLRYLQWPYNEGEAPAWRELCASLNLGFEAIPAFGDPLTPQSDAASFKREVDFRMAGGGGMRFDPLVPSAVPDFEPAVHTEDDVAAPEPSTPPTEVCTLIADRLVVDSKGDAYLCCAYPNEPRLKIGPYTELSAKDLFLKRLNHEFCKTCAFPTRLVTDEDLEKIGPYFT